MSQVEREGPRPSYKEIIQAEHAGSRMWDYLRYDNEGDLWINGMRVKEAIEAVASKDHAGTPLEITDTTIIERRCREWEEMTQRIAEKVGYKGGFDYFYASKANRASEFVHAAIRSGWNLETSSKQDIDDLEVFAKNGLVDKDNIEIICNGFKLPPDNRWDTIRLESGPSKGNIVFEHMDGIGQRDSTYAENILRLHNEGFRITPILDEGEVDYFIDNADRIDVGIRMKFGKVSNDTDLKKLTSRFGMIPEEVEETADKIDASSNLRLKMLHTMVGAAETIKEEEFAEHLAFGLDKYFDLAEKHPTLTHFNIGGGIPPLFEKYDHEAFLTKFLTEAKKKAQERDLPEPVITFELGSYVSAEAGFYVLDVIQQKENSVDEEGKPVNWMLLDGSLMEAIPDMLITQKSFVILGADNANYPSTDVILGDLTCDSDGRFPQKVAGVKNIKLPNAGVKNFVVIIGVGAYQEQLAGVRGGHHCGLLEAAEVIVEKKADGTTRARVMPRQTLVDSQDIFGYNEPYLSKLRETVE